MSTKILAISVIYLMFTLSGRQVYGQTTGKAIPRDWYKLDPVADSIAGISLDKAYDLLKGRAFRTVVVAVIDNGIDIDHEDLKNIIWTNTREIPANGIDDDRNGYIDDVHGWNFRGSTNGIVIENELSSSTQLYLAWKRKFEGVDTNRLTPHDKKKFALYARAKKDYLDKAHSKDSSDILFAYNIHYNSSILIANDGGTRRGNYGSPVAKLSINLTHGTHVAGLIAAQRGNNIGIDGVADHVLIMPLLATTALGDERDKDVASAIFYAVDNGAQIINMSFSKLFSPEKADVDAAIRYAEKKDVLIVHAAGNDGVDIDSDFNYHYPVAIDEDGRKASNFVCVGWNRALFDYRLAHPRSDYGKSNVDLFAPGSDIFSTVPDNKYGFKSGSSMSAPIVSGIAALLRSYFPSLTAPQVKDILLQSSFTTDQSVNVPLTQIKVPFNTLSVSGGIVNALGAVTLAIDRQGR